MFTEFMPFHVKDGNVILRVKVTPGASQTRISSIENDAHGKPLLKIYVSAPANDGKANDALVRYISGLFDIKYSNIKIISGHTARNKNLELKEIDPIKMMSILLSYTKK